ncbi:hypothetical protein AZ66_14035 [Paenibacillus sp. E194]|uniref:hypothetical protein n=1 Tax=Paenibacillus sp. E194 TaxID=1458845 RepID=UPI0005CAD506|nr:hypothetical protein [Paenibacillus sp. E194]KJB87267.1 hypothetical protein AZ66_14035 [Paenibacillus sp. E194]
MHTNIEAVRAELLKLAESTNCSQTYRRRLLKLLQKAVPFDAACCTSVDPQTLLSTGSVTDAEVELMHDSIFEYTGVSSRRELIWHLFSRFSIA